MLHISRYRTIGLTNQINWKVSLKLENTFFDNFRCTFWHQKWSKTIMSMMWNLNNPLRVIRVGWLSVTVQRQSSLQHQLRDWSLLPAACLLTPGPATVWESIKTVFLWWYLGGTWWTVACWWQLYEQLQSVSRLVCGVWPGSESQPSEFVWYEWN